MSAKTTVAEPTLAPSRKRESPLRRTANVPTEVSEVLRDEGRPLDSATLELMEGRFADHAMVPVSSRPASGDLRLGAPGDREESEADRMSNCGGPARNGGAAIDLSGVRIHVGSSADRAARSIRARAFAVAGHIVFRDGEFNPHSSEGRKLLAHELAHTLQPGATTTIRRKDPKSDSEAGDPKVLKLPPDNRKAPPQSTTPKAKADKVANMPPVKIPKVPTGNHAAAKLQEAAKAAINTAAAKPPVGAKDAEVAKDPTKKPEEQKKKDPESLADVSTGGLDLIDSELAEHERWGSAKAQVGEASSAERAKFVAKEGGAGSNFVGGALEGAKGTLKTVVINKIAEKVAEKLAVKLATKVGAAGAKFTPLPAVGAVIGGVMAAYDLAGRDWRQTGETIGKFGEGDDMYETLANSIEAISTIIDVASNVLSIIAGVIGAISIAMWAITIVTVGIASPLAATLSTIAAAIGIATGILDAINALVLKQLVTVFRALHTYTSDADPSDVVTQGAAIEKAAADSSGALGGFVGGKLADKGIGAVSKRFGPKEPHAPVPDHADPAPATGNGARVKGTPPAEGAHPASHTQEAPAPAAKSETPTPQKAAPEAVTATPEKAKQEVATAKRPESIKEPVAPAKAQAAAVVPEAKPTAPKTAEPHAPEAKAAQSKGPEATTPETKTPEHNAPKEPAAAAKQEAKKATHEEPKQEVKQEPHPEPKKEAAPEKQQAKKPEPSTEKPPEHKEAAKPADEHAKAPEATEKPADSKKQEPAHGPAAKHDAEGGGKPPHEPPKETGGGDKKPPGPSVDDRMNLLKQRTEELAFAWHAQIEQRAAGVAGLPVSTQEGLAKRATNAADKHVAAKDVARTNHEAAKATNKAQRHGPDAAAADANHKTATDAATQKRSDAETAAKSKKTTAEQAADATYKNRKKDAQAKEQAGVAKADAKLNQKTADLATARDAAKSKAPESEHAKIDSDHAEAVSKAQADHKREVKNAKAAAKRYEKTGAEAARKRAKDKAANDLKKDVAKAKTTEAKDVAKADKAKVSELKKADVKLKKANKASARERDREYNKADEAYQKDVDHIVNLRDRASRMAKANKQAPGPVSKELSDHVDASFDKTFSEHPTGAPVQPDRAIKMKTPLLVSDVNHPVAPGTEYIPPLAAAEGHTGRNREVGTKGGELIREHVIPGAQQKLIAPPGVYDYHGDWVSAVKKRVADHKTTGPKQRKETHGEPDPGRHSDNRRTKNIKEGGKGVTTRDDLASLDNAHHSVYSSELAYVRDAIRNTEADHARAQNPKSKAPVPEGPRLGDAHGLPATPREAHEYMNALKEKVKQSQQAQSANAKVDRLQAEAARPKAPGEKTPSPEVTQKRIEKAKAEATRRNDKFQGTDSSQPVGGDLWKPDPKGSAPRPSGPTPETVNNPPKRPVAVEGRAEPQNKVEPAAKVEPAKKHDPVTTKEPESKDQHQPAKPIEDSEVAKASPDMPKEIATKPVAQPAKVEAEQPPQTVPKPEHAKDEESHPKPEKQGIAQPGKQSAPKVEQHKPAPQEQKQGNHPAKPEEPAVKIPMPEMKENPEKSRRIEEADHDEQEGPEKHQSEPPEPSAVPVSEEPAQPATAEAPELETPESKEPEPTKPHTPAQPKLATPPNGKGPEPQKTPANPDKAPKAEDAPKDEQPTEEEIKGAAAPIGKPDVKDERSQFTKNLDAAMPTGWNEMGTRDKVATVLATPASDIAARMVVNAESEFSKGFDKSKREPVIERVNPHYQDPPCKPQDIVNVQNDILQNLDARAKAEDAAAAMSHEVKAHEKNEEPLNKVKEKTEKTITATQAHQDAIQRRTAANQSKQGSEKDVGTTVDSYADKAASLSTIIIPMKAFGKFAGLASSLPDSPGCLRNAKFNLLHMSNDAKKFVHDLESVDTSMNDQKTEQPKRLDNAKEDGDTLNKTSDKAKESSDSLDDNKTDTETITKANADKKSEATKIKGEGQQAIYATTKEAKDKTTKSQSLAAQLQAWAEGHKQARMDAIEQTRQKYEKMGYTNIEVTEK